MQLIQHKTFVLMLSYLLSLFCMVSNERKNLMVCASTLLRLDFLLSLLMLVSCPLALISCVVFRTIMKLCTAVQAPPADQ